MAKTNSTPPTSKRPWYRALRALAVAGILFFVLQFLLAWAIEARHSSAVARLGGEWSLSIADYIPPPLPPEIVNATDFIEAAGIVSEGQAQVHGTRTGAAPVALQRMHRRFRQLDLDRSPPSADDLASFRAVVDRHAQGLAVLANGLDSATGARFVTDYSVPVYQVVVPNLLIRLRFGSLLRARAELAAADGDAAGAWQDATRIFQLAHWTADDAPTLINALVARAIARQGAMTVQSLLAVATGTAELRAPVADWAGRRDAIETMNRMLGAERAMAFDTLLHHPDAWNGFEGRTIGRTAGVHRRLAGWQPWRRLLATAYLESAAPRFAACAAPSHQRNEVSASDIPAPPGWAGPARVMWFDCDDVGRKRDLWLADQHQVQIALALEDAYERMGRYPETLGALEGPGTLPTDPFSNAPYRYRREGDGYRLYSVSLNGTDDEGALPSAGGNGFADPSDGDWVWRVARAPASN